RVGGRRRACIPAACEGREGVRYGRPGHAGVGAGRTEAVCARAHNPAVRGNPEVGRHPAAPVAPFSAGRAVECPAVRGGYGWRGSVADRRTAGIGRVWAGPRAVLTY